MLYNAGYTVKTYTSSGSYNYFSWWKSFATTGQVDTALYNRIMKNGTLFGDGKGGIGNPANPTTAARPGISASKKTAPTERSPM